MKDDEYVEEKVERFALKCPGFPLGSSQANELLRVFIHTIVKDMKDKYWAQEQYYLNTIKVLKEGKPKVSKKEWMKFSREYDGEYTDDYYKGANCLFEWLKIIGVEVEE